MVTLLSWEVGELASDPVRQRMVPHCRAEQSCWQIGWVGSRQGYLDGNPSQTCLSRPEGLGPSLLAGWDGWSRLLEFSACMETSAFPNIDLGRLQADWAKTFTETSGSFAELHMKSFMCTTKPHQSPELGFARHRLRSLWNFLVTVLQIRVSQTIRVFLWGINRALQE